jgi:hypothetical protein
MRKLLISAICLLAFSGVSHAGFLDKLSGAAAKVESIKQSGNDATAMSNPKEFYLVLIKQKLGAKATPEQVASQIGKPTVDQGVNAAGVQIYLYDNAVILAYLGSVASMVSSMIPADQQTQFTFTNAVLTDIKIVPAVTVAVATTAATSGSTAAPATTPAADPAVAGASAGTSTNAAGTPVSGKPASSAKGTLPSPTSADQGSASDAANAVKETAEARKERCRKLLEPKPATQKVVDPTKPKPVLTPEQQQKLEEKKQQRKKERQDCLNG